MRTQLLALVLLLPSAPAFGASQSQTTWQDFLSGWGGGASNAGDGNVAVTNQAGGEVALLVFGGTVGAFSSAGTLPAPLSGHGLAFDRSRFWVIQGDSSTGPAFSAASAAVASAGQLGTFGATTTLPSGGTNDGAVVANGSAYWLSAGALYHAALPPSGGMGTVATTALSQTLYDASLAYGDGFLFIVGGRTSMSSSTSAVAGVSFAQPSALGALSSWTSATALPQPLYGAAVVTHGDGIFVLGGTTASGTLSSTIYAATIGASGTLSAWASAGTIAPGGGSGWAQGRAVVLNGYVYVVGGTNLGGTQGTHLYAALLSATPAALSPFVSAGAGPQPQGATLPLLRPGGAGANFVAASAPGMDNHLFVAGGGDGTTRYAQIFSAAVTPNASGAQGVAFQGNYHNQFDFGGLANVGTFGWNFQGSGGTSAQARYRLALQPAGDYGTWSSWFPAGSVSVNQQGRYLEYHVRLKKSQTPGAGPDWIRLEDANVTYTLVTETPTPSPTPYVEAIGFPNPYRAGRDSLRVEYPPAKTAKLVVTTLSGKPVRTVAVTPAQAQQGRAVWDGRDGAGRVVAPGAYYFLVQTNDGSYRGKVSVTK